MTKDVPQLDPAFELRLAREVMHETTSAVVVIDEQGRIIFFNPAAESVFGYSFEEVVGGPLEQLIPMAHRRAHQGYVDAYRASGDSSRYMASRNEVCGQRRDGEEFPASISIMRLDLFEQTCLAAVVRDLTETHSLELERIALARAVEQSRDMVWITDPDGVVRFVNESFAAHVGYTVEECIGRRTSQIWQSGHHDPAFYRDLWKTIQEGKPYQGIFTNRRRDGELIYIDETISPVFDQQGRIQNYIATGRDITERMEQEQALRAFAYYDELTGLPNRYLFQERVGQAMERARRDRSGMALLFIDLDGFKQVNDQHGHKVGDVLLAAVAANLQQAVRSEDTLARIGGDEFLLLAERVTTRSCPDGVRCIREISERLLEAVAKPIRVEDTTFYLGASVGISFYPDDGEQVEVLIARADEAMYRAKATTGSTYHFYSDADSEQDSEQLNLEEALRCTLNESGEFGSHLEVKYLPAITADGGLPMAVEALARWHVPGFGEVSAERLFTTAFHAGLVEYLTRSLVSRALTDFAEWCRAGLPVAELWLNWNEHQLQRESLDAVLLELVAENGVEPGRIRLELPEACFNDHPREVERLASLGFALAMDDFGTAETPLRDFPQLPVEALKLDRSLVERLESESEARMLVAMALRLGEELGLRVVAEGVEKGDTAIYLRDQGVTTFQGFLFAEPLAERDILLWNDPEHERKIPNNPVSMVTSNIRPFAQ